MRKDLVSLKPVHSSFFSCSTDAEKILRTLFVTSRPHSDMLKRLLIINNPDCLDTTNEKYQKIIDSFSLSDLMEKGYVKLNPKVSRSTHQEIKTYIILSFDSFYPNEVDPIYLDYTLHFDVLSNNDEWSLDDYKVRPVMICGYIDGILQSLSNNNKMAIKSHKPQIKLSGIGEYNLLGCTEHILNEDFGMYTLSYRGVHLSEDIEELGEVDNG